MQRMYKQLSSDDQPFSAVGENLSPEIAVSADWEKKNLLMPFQICLITSFTGILTIHRSKKKISAKRDDRYPARSEYI